METHCKICTTFEVKLNCILCTTRQMKACVAFSELGQKNWDFFYFSQNCNDMIASNFDFQYDQLCAKGNFSREDIVTVLTANEGNVEAAFQELNKVQLKPFLMRIWGQGETGEVTSGQIPDEKLGTT